MLSALKGGGRKRKQGRGSWAGRSVSWVLQVPPGESRQVILNSTSKLHAEMDMTSSDGAHRFQGVWGTLAFEKELAQGQHCSTEKMWPEPASKGAGCFSFLGEKQFYICSR